MATKPKCIHHVGLNVYNLQRSIEFYTGLLGLSVAEFDEHKAKLRLGKSELALFKIPDDARNAGNASSDNTQLHLNHIAFEVDKKAFEVLHEKIKHHEVHITFGPISRRNGTSLYFLDPDGNKIELFCCLSDT